VNSLNPASSSETIVDIFLNEINTQIFRSSSAPKLSVKSVF